MKNSELADKIELLKIQLRHLRNDYLLTKEQYEKSTSKYLEILIELKKKNEELQKLREDLEKTVKERTKELAESEEKYRLLAENTSDYCYFLNISRHGVITVDWVGGAFQRITGYPIEYIYDYEKWFSIIHPDDIIKVQQGTEAVLSSQTSVFEYRIKTKFGEERWLCDRIYPIRDEKNQRIVSAIGAVQDITERKKAEEEKKKIEAQFFQAQKMESIGRLAGSIAHDFNNILVSIMGYAELLNVRFPDEATPVGKASSVILKGTVRASNLTKQLLGFARAGNYERKPININEALLETIEVLEKIFEKKINVICAFEKDINLIDADENQLDQIFSNIFINAKDAMPNGGDLKITTKNITIDRNFIEKHPEIQSGAYVEISISDSGIGISKDVINHIFEPFYTTKGEGKGTGLGLASVYGIVKIHNGYIYCSSKPEKGATFTIYFPVSNKVIIESESHQVIRKGNGSILVVDDEEDVRYLTKEMLEELGYEVLTAESGNEAVEIFKKKKDEIDIVILDMIMPVMSGGETYFQLKKIKEGVRVLLASGLNRDGEMSEILNDGVLGFIQKPFRMEELSKLISEALNK